MRWRQPLKSSGGLESGLPTGEFTVECLSVFVDISFLQDACEHLINLKSQAWHPLFT